MSGEVEGAGLPADVLQRFVDQTRSFAKGAASRRANGAGAGRTGVSGPRRQADLDPDGVRPDSQRDRPRRHTARQPHRDDGSDVTVSTNLGPWVNRRGLFARESMADTFKAERIPSTYSWSSRPRPASRTRHRGIEPVSSRCRRRLSHSINGERLLPIGTVYDPSSCAPPISSTMPAIRMRASCWWRRPRA